MQAKENTQLQQAKKIMKSFVELNEENKKSFKHCRILDVKEFRMTNAENKATKALVLYVPYPFHSQN